MIEVEEITDVFCDKCGDAIYQGEEFYTFAVRCKCGDRKVIRLCKECIEAAKEVNHGILGRS